MRGGTFAILFLFILAGCARHTSQVAHRPEAALAPLIVRAIREEAIGDSPRASSLYLDAIDRALDWPGDSWALAVIQASLDALVERKLPALSEVTFAPALAFRTPDDNRTTIIKRLASVYDRADDPFTAGLVARALEDLAEDGGDTAGAERWRHARGCAREATVIGPLAAGSLIGLTEPDPLSETGPIKTEYATSLPFSHAVSPVVASGTACQIDLFAPSAATGIRDVIVDVTVPYSGPIGIAMRSRSAATLRVGGKVVLERPHEPGPDEAVRFARVVVSEGRVRIVARLGAGEGAQSIELDAWDAHGRPLAIEAPRPGGASGALAQRADGINLPIPRTDDERIALGAAALAMGNGRTAEYLLSGPSASSEAPPEMLLIYARAIETARDLTPVHRAERARSVYERVLEKWPPAWEPLIAHAVLAGVRRGQSEARLESLHDLDLRRANLNPPGAPVLDAFDAVMSARERLFDRAQAARDRVKARLAASSLYLDVERASVPRGRADQAAFLCANAAPYHRANLDCYSALRETGNASGASRELLRLRALLGAPHVYQALELRDLVAASNLAGARQVFEEMPHGEQTLAGLVSAQGANGKDGHIADNAEKLRDRVVMAASSARDAPIALPPLLRALGDNPFVVFEGEAERLAAADRNHPTLADAATAVLIHSEWYNVLPNGLLRCVVHDVRRVSGTTDVEENAQAEAPELFGRTLERAIRRRIFKKDGRVLEPDRTPHASQSHADLTQLEQGDIVEAVYEGWVLPGETGNLGFDSPDLLPERTAVANASIELRFPSSLVVSLASHPLLNKPDEKTNHGERVLRWTLHDHPARRFEEGTPRMDRNVAVSFSTLTWTGVARALRETMASVEEHNPEITRFAHQSTEGGTKSLTAQEKVERMVTSVGTTVKEASSSLLSDLGVSRTDSGGQITTARTILTTHEGSRTWLVVRALREVGIAADVVLAENEPYSENPLFPAHFSRFSHPLAIAHLGPNSDLWIDADVAGPPLPAGKISPELRGRKLLRSDGSIASVPNVGQGDAQDEIDLRLTVDAKGDARGSFTILLRGRAAQELAESLVRTVGFERQRALRSVVLAWVPFATVDDVALSSREGSWEVALRADLQIRGYAQAEGPATPRQWILPGIDPLHIVYPRSYTSTLSATYAGQGGRENALAISRTVQYHAHRRIELPGGTRIVRLPGSFEIRSPHLDARRRTSVAGTTIEDDFVLGVPTGTLGAQEFGGFAAATHHADDAFLSSTRVSIGP